MPQEINPSATFNGPSYVMTFICGRLQSDHLGCQRQSMQIRHVAKQNLKTFPRNLGYVQLNLINETFYLYSLLFTEVLSESSLITTA